MITADGGDGKDINLLMVKDRDDWMCQQDILKLRTIFHARLKVYVFGPLGMMCVTRILVA